jgi:osmotically-inducible protein OsmY
MHQQCGRAIAAFAVVAAMFCGAPASAQQTAPDNTKVNQRDRAQNAKTADQQKENPQDRAITQQIRKAIMDDKALSTYAHNVKVITQDGKVTLKGPVRSAEEKRSIEAKATEVAGAGHVTNQISVAPEKDKGDTAKPVKR